MPLKLVTKKPGVVKVTVWVEVPDSEVARQVHNEVVSNLEFEGYKIQDSDWELDPKQ
jgi:hypothetical protein